MKENKLKITNKMLAIMVAGGITFSPIVSNAINYKPGTFIELSIDESKLFNQYVVKEGDNASIISQKICRYFDEEVTTKYWPAIAFLNAYPRTINPGDIIIFPKTFERLQSLNEDLKETGWTNRYVKKNKIYKKKNKEKISRDNIESLLYEIYGDSVCIDEDFIHLYLEIQGLDDKYALSDNSKFVDDQLFYLTEWIPTLDELNEYRKNNSSKIKKLK